VGERASKYWLSGQALDNRRVGSGWGRVRRSSRLAPGQTKRRERSSAGPYPRQACLVLGFSNWLLAEDDKSLCCLTTTQTDPYRRPSRPMLESEIAWVVLQARWCWLRVLLYLTGLHAYHARSSSLDLQKNSGLVCPHMPYATPDAR
jgi:hypothetical protein